MPDLILAVNAGSSSLKLALFHASRDEPVARGRIANLGDEPHLTMSDTDGRLLTERRWPAGAELADLLRHLLAWVNKHVGSVAAAGHRIVHGGGQFSEPVRLDAASIAAIEALTPLAPLHQPGTLAPIRALTTLCPNLPQVACFDTAFHHGLTPPVSRYAIPRALEAKGIRRYGFHGLSYEFIAGRLAEVAPGLAQARVVVAHLGSGASLCAMQNGQSRDTTMGFTALDGLVMGTRCGSIDPGVLLFLQQAEHLSVDEVERMLYHDSGLLGVSGLSPDIRDLLASDKPEAAEAVDLFAFSIARHVAALACTLGGLDGLVFTGGIGEHIPEVRARVCERLRWLGVMIDPHTNAAGEERIAATDLVDIRVIPTDEERMIARHVRHALHP